MGHGSRSRQCIDHKTPAIMAQAAVMAGGGKERRSLEQRDREASGVAGATQKKLRAPKSRRPVAEVPYLMAGLA